MRKVRLGQTQLVPFLPQREPDGGTLGTNKIRKFFAQQVVLLESITHRKLERPNV